jgi:hypothetical protein
MERITVALHDGISAENSPIEDTVRKARRYEKALATIRPRRGSDRDSSHDSHASNARRTESHEDSTSPELGDPSFSGVGPVRELEALTEQDETSDSSQSNDDSEAEDSLTAEHDKDLDKETSYPEESDDDSEAEDTLTVERDEDTYEETSHPRSVLAA